MKNLVLVILQVIVYVGGAMAEWKDNAVLVPDAKTAVRIAEAICEAKYGNKIVTNYQPYSARLEGDNWTVIGTPADGSTRAGGMPEVIISKIDGRVVHIQLSR
jgi:hypothetical protein